MSTKDSIHTSAKRIITLMVTTILVLSTFAITTFAASAKTEVPGQIYEFGKDSHNNVKAEPTIYTNYLEANTSVGADTKVQLFEEGDYEVDCCI